MGAFIGELVGAAALGLLGLNLWLLLGHAARRTGRSRSAVLLWLITVGWIGSR